MTLKKSLVVLHTTYTRWILSSRLLIFAFAYMFFYVYFIEPQLTLSKMFNTPLNALEPFAALVNNGYFLPLTVMTYLILISDRPKLDDSATFILFRTGRLPWLLGQIFFIMCSALTFIFFLLFSSMITVASKSFCINAWSLSAKNAISSENALLHSYYPFAIIDSSVITQARPYKAILHGVILVLMFMVVTGLIMMIFALLRKKVLGLFTNMSILAVGLVLWAVDIKAKWLFPIANTAFGWHYDEIYNKTIVPIEFSYVYYFVLLGILLWLSAYVVKRCSFHIVGEND